MVMVISNKFELLFIALLKIIMSTIINVAFLHLFVDYYHTFSRIIFKTLALITFFVD